MFEKVWKICEERGINMYQLSIGTGIAYANIHCYVNGKRKPKLENLRKMAEFLKVELSEII